MVPNEETLRRIAGGEDFLRWIMPCLAGDDDERETALVMILAQFEERYIQGIRDARNVAEMVAASKPQSRDLAVIASALAKLEERASEDRFSSLGPAA